MAKKMLIDAAHPEETRVVVSDGNRLEEFDYESDAKRQLRGNIYLAKVTRVEPSLQAAFVDYGGNRHGFLAFNEIHPDYYQIPYEDRQKLIQEEEADDDDDEADASESEDGADDDEADDIVEQQLERRRKRAMRRYKIQEVIKRRQIMLVQVVKEERGNKGAALTTYLSLAGRYCVLMPNTSRGGGISRKIASAADRKRLKSIVSDLNVPKGMGLIIRTAGAKRTKAEIKRDYEYLLRLWERIREQTLQSTAPALIHEEGNLVKRSIRDLYDKDIEIVLVEGDEAYKQAKDFMRVLMPSHAKKVQPYRDRAPLFQRHQMESQIDQIYEPVVQLKSGGYLVINTTEALVAIDVNSGRATKERNVEATALNTNLEAAEEACRQMRLRDLAGLLVIDFIDMEENKNNRAVEKKLRDALKADRARVQVGRISQFGLLEMSRQRRRASLLEGSTRTCPTCEGLGFTRTVRSAALHALRQLEEEAVRERSAVVRLSAPAEVAMYLLNEKRGQLQALEARFGLRVIVQFDETLTPPEIKIEQVEELSGEARARLEEAEQARVKDQPAEPEEPESEDADIEDEDEDEDEDDSEAQSEDGDAESGGQRPRRRRRGRRGGRGGGQKDAAREDGDKDADASDGGDDSDDPSQSSDAASGGEDDASEKPRRRRRRGRRGGRGRRSSGGEKKTPETAEESGSEQGGESQSTESEPASDDTAEEPAPAKRAPRKRSPKKEPEGTGLEVVQPIAAESAEAAAPQELGEPVSESADEPEAASSSEVIAFPEPEEAPKRKTRARKPKDDPAAADAAEEAPKKPARSRRKKAEAEAEPANEDRREPEPAEAGDDKPRRRGWWQRG